jgi:outer membrane receptor protein involved in Fe transport
VKPEKVTTYEVGIKTTFLDRAVTFNAALFYNDYRDMQLFALVPSPIGPLNLAANAEKARTYGADIDLTVRPVRNLTLSAQVGLLNTKLAVPAGGRSHGAGLFGQPAGVLAQVEHVPAGAVPYPDRRKPGDRPAI